MEGERFVLHNVTPRLAYEEEGEIYEELPAGYISFPSFEDYKKIKKLIKGFPDFLNEKVIY